MRVVSGVDTGTHLTVDGDLSVGRAGVDIRLHDPRVSRRHASLAPHGDGLVVWHLSPTAPTSVDGVPVDRRALAAPGSVITLGSTVLLVLRPVASAGGTGAARLALTSPTGDTRVLDLVDEVVLGRAAPADVPVPDPRVSARHAVVRPSSGGAMIEDLGSRNGTQVNGRTITGAHRLVSGDEVSLGRSAWRVEVRVADASASSIDIRARREGGTVERAVRLELGEDATVGEVAAALDAYLDDEPRSTTTRGRPGLYRPQDGMHPGSDLRWAEAGARRGDLFVVADLPEPRAGSLHGPPPVPNPAVSPGPRRQRPPEVVEIKGPRVPESPSMRGRGVSWQIGTGALAALGGITIAFVTHIPMLALVGAAVGLGTVLLGVLGDRSRRRYAAAEFTERLATLETRLASVAAEQKESFRDQSPDLTTLDEWVRTRSPRLWERRANDPDHLRLTLGRGGRRVLVHVDRTDSGESAELSARLDTLVATHSTVSAVPVVGPGGGVLGIWGRRGEVQDLVAHLVLEAAVLHAPSALGLQAVGWGEDYGWMRWLPHVVAAPEQALPRTVEECRASLSRLESDLRAGSWSTRRLVILSRSAVPEASDVLRLWTADRGLLVVLADEERDLPAEVDVRLRVADRRADPSGLPDAVGHLAPVAADPARAAGLALALGRFSDPRARTGGRTASTGLLDLAGLPALSRDDVLRSWKDHARQVPTGVLGVDQRSTPVEIDLRADGPHAVVAGTTGSGKSELLASLLASLVAGYPPDRLTLFLIDYKGGATFNRIASLPHVVGLVTDLEADSRLARRAFVALEAEITRRKRLLAAAGCADISAYEELPDRDPLALLVVVIDEFALLVQQQPEVRARLDNVATQGRSLGVHLVLATQSPAGVVTPALRANTNLWLCLRVVNEMESLEIIGSRDGARIPVDAPGRGLVRRGAEETVVEFQTARITRLVQQGRVAASVRPLADERPARARSAATPRGAVRELDRLVEVILEVGAPAAQPLWLAPLPESVTDDDLPAATEPGPTQVLLALADQPALQRRTTWTPDLDAGHLLVTGAPRSGRTTTLLRVATDLAGRAGPDALHVYALDARGGLDPLLALPHTAAVVGVDDRERLDRLLGRLSRTVEERRTYRPANAPRILLLIDDYAMFKEATEDLDDGRGAQVLQSLVGAGRGVGLHLAVATTQPHDLRVVTSAAFGPRLMLRAADRADYAALDVRVGADDLPPAVAGRGLVADGIEVQVVRPHLPAASPTGQVALGGPRPVERMPLDLSRAGLTLRTGGPAAAWTCGVGGPELEPLTLDPVRVGEHVLVLGESSTGRSTALATIAAGAPAETRFAVFAPRTGPLSVMRDDPRCIVFATTPDDVDALLDACESAPAGLVVLVDDAESWPARTSDRTERALRAARDTGLRAFVAARTTDWARSFDGWTRYLGSLRTAIVLGPGAQAGHVLEVRLPAARGTVPPGRGHLVSRGASLELQVLRD
ncbi:FtsK/SpoIIIE domain-containing protein [Cellulomonas sp. URHD0024]|uniref:FtsK/SpoIIIE domain-containing protein n=1 Tax=Cellulomonas sp. URHD0024 TaxID=1302620 RepID=UPI0012DD39C8|nr:FtsK/SpoIIIE domain-containing protein [Cellulomonas sp. URHD0024]